MSILSGADAATQLQESRQPDIYAACIITYTLAVVAVALRFASRRMVRAGYWLDDWLIVVALIFASGLSAIVLYGIHTGLGKHMPAALPNIGSLFFKVLFGIELVYPTSLLFVKFAILALYWRLFKGKRYMRNSIYVLATFAILWWSAGVITIMLQCMPIQAFWDRTKAASCRVDLPAFFIVSAVPNIITDFVLLALPLHAVWQLHSGRVQKIALTATFLIGGFVCIVSIVRIIELIDNGMKSHDLTWQYSSPAIWTCVEANIAIVSACLPLFRPILRLFTRQKEWTARELQDETSQLAQAGATWQREDSRGRDSVGGSIARRQEEPYDTNPGSEGRRAGRGVATPEEIEMDNGAAYAMEASPRQKHRSAPLNLSELETPSRQEQRPRPPSAQTGNATEIWLTREFSVVHEAE